MDGLVSIVITCYNAADFVADAIDSALAQSYPAVEVVVVDDASTDGSREVVAGYGERVRALRLPVNGGASRTRNRGAGIARGEWLMFLDADDFIAPDTIEGLVEAGRRAPGALVACPWEFRVRQPEGWLSHVPPRPFAPVGDPLAGWLQGAWAPSCALLQPRHVYLSCGGFDETLRRKDDGDLVMRAFAGGAGLALATRGRGFYRRHMGTRPSLSTDDQSGAVLRCHVRVLDKLVARLASQGRLDEYLPLIEVQYGHVASHAFLVGDFAVARDCLARGGRGAAGVVRSATVAGRLLAAALGPERKHRVTRVLRGWRAALRRAAGRGGEAARRVDSAATPPAPIDGSRTARWPTRPTPKPLAPAARSSSWRGSTGRGRPRSSTRSASISARRGEGVLRPPRAERRPGGDADPLGAGRGGSPAAVRAARPRRRRAARRARTSTARR